MDTGEELPNNVLPARDAQNNVTYWKSSTTGLYVYVLHYHNLQYEDDAMMGPMIIDPPRFNPLDPGSRGIRGTAPWLASDDMAAAQPGSAMPGGTRGR